MPRHIKGLITDPCTRARVVRRLRQRGVTYKAIGQALGITLERVRQIWHRADRTCTFRRGRVRIAQWEAEEARRRAEETRRLARIGHPPPRN